MISLPGGVLPLAEQLELIRTIGRNIAGDPLPPPAASPAPRSPAMAIAAEARVAQASGAAAPDIASADHPLERWQARDASLSLAGLRQPLSTLPGASVTMQARAIVHAAAPATGGGGKPSVTGTGPLPQPSPGDAPARDGTAPAARTGPLPQPAPAAAPPPDTGEEAIETEEAPARRSPDDVPARRAPAYMMSLPGRLVRGADIAATRPAGQDPADMAAVKGRIAGEIGLAATDADTGPVPGARMTASTPAPPAAMAALAGALTEAHMRQAPAAGDPQILGSAAMMSDPGAPAEPDDPAHLARGGIGAGASAGLAPGVAPPLPQDVEMAMAERAPPAAGIADGDVPPGALADRAGVLAAGFAASPPNAAQVAMVERALLALGVAGEGALPAFASASGPLAERAGVLASFILNAHFLPGWPPPRPLENVEAKEMLKEPAQAQKLTKNELEMLTYLANFGFNRQQLARIMALMLQARRKSGLLDAIARFFTNLGAVLTVLHDELELVVADYDADRQGRRRSRIDLR